MTRWSSSASPMAVPARPGSRSRLTTSAASNRFGGQVRAEGRQAGMDGLGPRLEDLDDGSVEADRHRSLDLQHQRGPGGREPPRFPRAVAMPGAVHAQVGPHGQAAGRADQQVLAQRLDRRHRRPHEPPHIGAARGRRCEYGATDEVWAQAGRRPVDRVALGHGGIVPCPGAGPRRGQTGSASSSGERSRSYGMVSARSVGWRSNRPIRLRGERSRQPRPRSSGRDAARVRQSALSSRVMRRSSMSTSDVQSMPGVPAVPRAIQALIAPELAGPPDRGQRHR